MKHVSLYMLMGTLFGFSPRSTQYEFSTDSVWFPLPKGFDQTKPDEILEHVRAAYQEDVDKMPFSHFYIFGDSACDTHNNYDANRGLEPDPKVYWRGRVSNGPMWPDYLESRFGMQMKNYAYSGATVNGTKYKFAENIPDFKKQVDNYETSRFNTAYPLAIIQWVGNDMINTNITAEDVATDIEVQLQRLVNMGEIRHILVLESTTLGYLEKGFNQALIAMVENFKRKNPHVSITSYPVVNDYGLMIRSPPPTADPGKWHSFEFSCYDPTSKKVCPDPQNYFLYDLYHPSTVPSYNVAARIAKNIRNTYPELDYSCYE